jgi:3-oxoacyl-[acyl-carrier protein] reductase
MELKDLKVIITGGASGMGFHFATRLSEAGAQVAVGDINEAGLGELPKGVHTHHLDVRDEKLVAEFVDWAADAMGGVNCLINNAGLIRDSLLVKKDKKTGDIIKMPSEDWHLIVDINLHGATYMVREVVAKMVETEQRPGVIVNISSIARHGNRGQSNYVATKAAMAANTVSWCREFAQFGIRVGCVAPGMIDTPLTGIMNQKAKDAFVAKIPVGRSGRPEDIWQAVRFVIECDFFNGRVIDVDGGMGF